MIYSDVIHFGYFVWVYKKTWQMEMISWLYTNFVNRDKMIISRQYEEP